MFFEDLLHMYRYIYCKKLSPYCGRNLTLRFYLISLYAYLLTPSPNALLTLKPKLRLGALLQCTSVATILAKKILFKICVIIFLCQTVASILQSCYEFPLSESASTFSWSTIFNKKNFLKKYNHIYLCKNIISHRGPTPTKGIRFARIWIYRNLGLFHTS